MRISPHRAVAALLVLTLLAAPVAAYTATSGTLIGATGGPQITLGKDYDLQNGNPTNDTAGTVRLETAADGSITFQSNVETNATIDEISGTYTNVSSIDATAGDLNIQPDDKQNVTVNGSITQVNVTSMTVDDGTTDFIYDASGTGHITIRGLPTNSILLAAEGATLIDSAQTDGTGTAVFELSTATDREIELHTTAAPTANDAAMSPAEGTQLTSSSVTLSVPVNDTDFPISDTVTADFYVDNVLAGTDTLTANGTAQLAHTEPDGGTHEWRVELTDNYGTGVDYTTVNRNFSVPSQVSIRNETDESQLITKQADVIIYARDGIPIDERPTATGQVNMEGLPVGDAFIVQVNITHYGQRTVYVDDIFEQADVFMLNRTQHSTAEVEFVVTDNTGDYPPDTSIIKIQRALNRSLFTTNEEDFRWITITGDVLGADRTHKAVIQRYTRYRIVMENTDGDQAILGEYSTNEDDVVPLTIGQRRFDFTAQKTDDVTYGANVTESGGTHYVRFSLKDEADETTDVNVLIYERNNESNVIHDQTHAGPYGTLSISQPIPDAHNDTSWIVEWNASKTGLDERIGATVVAGGSDVDPGVTASDWVKETAAFAITVLIFMVTSGGANRYVGAVITPLVAGVFWVGGWMPPEIGVGVIIFAMAIGSGYFMQGSQGSGF